MGRSKYCESIRIVCGVINALSLAAFDICCTIYFIVQGYNKKTKRKGFKDVVWDGSRSLCLLNRDAAAANKVLRSFVVVAGSAIVTLFAVSHDSAVPLEAVNECRGLNGRVLNNSNEDSVGAVVCGRLHEGKGGSV